MDLHCGKLFPFGLKEILGSLNFGRCSRSPDRGPSKQNMQSFEQGADSLGWDFWLSLLSEMSSCSKINQQSWLQIIFKQNCENSRHIKNKRLSFTNIYAIVAA